MKFTCGRAGGRRIQRVPVLPASAGIQTGSALWKQCCSIAEVIDSLIGQSSFSSVSKPEMCI